MSEHNRAESAPMSDAAVALWLVAALLVNLYLVYLLFGS